ncbi:hypothetical protein K458DRAFT_130506 [Lentithecium fluviatile CBS 122367]|uniref:Uncharacterized protein n=1 Tax=Lentithecium fluviatile CBS 122367 TaxID=1168545 RepID=A0A6G1JHC6_9PLEO|nr:hypothetical protein K458DRAFT_130506 [Lentithecium fluviatile CBS 122367]
MAWIDNQWKKAGPTGRIISTVTLSRYRRLRSWTRNTSTSTTHAGSCCSPSQVTMAFHILAQAHERLRKRSASPSATHNIELSGSLFGSSCLWGRRCVCYWGAAVKWPQTFNLPRITILASRFDIPIKSGDCNAGTGSYRPKPSHVGRPSTQFNLTNRDNLHHLEQ